MKTSKKRSRNRMEKDPLSGDLSEMLKGDGWQSVRFEITEPKNKVISLRISEKLLKRIREEAKGLGIDTQKYIRLALENSIRGRKGA